MNSSSYRLRVTNTVVALLRTMHPHLKRKIRAALEMIVANPNEGKALRNDFTGLRGMRVSKFRIIYRIRQDVIEVIAVGPRARIYEETLRLIQREGGNSEH
jgi:mRNA interferase RelE/StbE